jgi:hypothetical protein
VTAAPELKEKRLKKWRSSKFPRTHFAGSGAEKAGAAAED